jgi:hypothetical protein
MMRAFDSFGSYGSYGGARYNMTVAAVPASALTTVLSGQLVVNATMDVDGAAVAGELMTATLNGVSYDDGCSSGGLSAHQDIRSSLCRLCFGVDGGPCCEIVEFVCRYSTIYYIDALLNNISTARMIVTYQQAGC